MISYICHVFFDCCTGGLQGTAHKNNDIFPAKECAEPEPSTGREKRIKLNIVSFWKIKNPQLQLLYTTILEQKPQVRYAVNASYSCILHKKAGSHIEYSEMRGGREEWKIVKKNTDFLETVLDFFLFF